jgi:hypothetical protein
VNSEPVTPGQVLQLKVTVTHLDGTTSDVTRDAKSKWLSETPGVIAVGPDGEAAVVAHQEAPGQGLGAVGVFYAVPR